MDKLKPMLKLALVVFVLYAIFSSPQQSADVVHEIWGVIEHGITNLGRFFNALLGKK